MKEGKLAPSITKGINVSDKYRNLVTVCCNELKSMRPSFEAISSYLLSNDEKQLTIITGPATQPANVASFYTDTNANGTYNLVVE